MIYLITLMARRDGSIGQFYPARIEVSAVNIIEARFKAVEEARIRGLETHHIIGVARVNEPT